MLTRLVVRACALVLLGSVVVACGDDDDGPTPDAGPDGGDSDRMDGSVSGRGGRGGSSGAGSGGSGGMMATDAGPVYQCEEPAPESGGSATKGEGCCSGLGLCTEKPVGPGSQAYGLSDCKAGADLKCAPILSARDDDAGASSAGAVCRATLTGAGAGAPDYEGRCVPSCFLGGDRSAANLGRASCDANSKCVPCFSPITGATTGACDQPGDAPKEAAPTAFGTCGDADTGLCVPAGLVASAAAGIMLPQLTCADGFLCAPKSSALTPGSCFAHCNSPLGGPGACIASFIVPAMQRGLLTREVCMEGELCVPCVNPLDPMRARTGACD